MQCKIHPVSSLSALTPDHMPVPSGRKLFIKIIFYLCISMRLCVCTHRGQKRLADPLELELEMDVSFLRLVLGAECRPCGRVTSTPQC